MKNILKRLIPEKFHWKMYNIYRANIVGWRSRGYSLLGEDIVSNVLLENMKEGFYVDIGAFHPEKYSNTAYFYKNNSWKGINIEPNPDNFTLFKKKRSRDINLNVGVGVEKTRLKYYMFEDGLYNTFDTDSVKDTVGKGHNVKKEVEIDVVPLNEILDENLKEGQQIDIMDIDVEGFDLAVLKSNNWSKYIPKVIIIEDHSFSFSNPEGSEIVKYILSKGYLLRSVNLFTLIFVRNENR